MKEWSEERKQTRFAELKHQHPGWTDDQIWTQISIEMAAYGEIDKAGPNVDQYDGDLIKTVLDKARMWLENVLPDVFNRVSQFFEELLSTISIWVQKGIKYVLDLIGKVLGR